MNTLSSFALKVAAPVLIELSEHQHLYAFIQKHSVVLTRIIHQAIKISLFNFDSF